MSSDTQEREIAPTSYREILDQVVEEGQSHLDRPATGLFLSGFSAGMDIGFGPFAMAVVMTFAGSELPTLLTEIATGIAYAVGFVFVVLGRSELFTEETSVAVVPVFTGDGSVSELGRTWGIIYVSNLIGGAIFAWLTVLVGPASRRSTRKYSARSPTV